MLPKDKSKLQLSIISLMHFYKDIKNQVNQGTKKFYNEKCKEGMSNTRISYGKYVLLFDKLMYVEKKKNSNEKKTEQ